MKSELVPANGDPPIPILKDVTVIGRRDGCDVQIDHHGLSKRHCVLVRTDGLLVLRDLASTNGTKVNGQRVRWAALLPNDKVAFAGYKCKVYLGSDDAPAPSEQRARNRPARPEPSPANPAASPPSEPLFPPPSLPEIITLGDEDLIDLDSGAAPPVAKDVVLSMADFESDDDQVIVLD